jgi:hypothetical protein
MDMGRFMGRDPTGVVGADANLYRYVDNDPLRNLDPRGEAAQPGSFLATNAPQPSDADAEYIAASPMLYMMARPSRNVVGNACNKAWPGVGEFAGPKQQGLELRVVRIDRVDTPPPRHDAAPWIALWVNGKLETHQAKKSVWAAWFKITYYWRIRCCDKNTGNELGWACTSTETMESGGHTPYSPEFTTQVDDLIARIKANNPKATVEYAGNSLVGREFALGRVPLPRPLLSWDKGEKRQGCTQINSTVGGLR